ncbi:MAG: alpha/beta hydrolase [Pseudomonadota bacterium]
MTDWDAAYDNRAAVGNAETYLDRWKTDASAFRDAMLLRLSCELNCVYGEKPRNRYDLFLPEGEARGLVIFIHGGYWRALDKSHFSHLAVGPLSHGWKVAIPSYTLAPEARISDITKEVANAISVLAKAHEGPIRLAGHSAGGHLVSRMLCDDNLLDDDVYARIENTVAVSGLFDLQHLPKTKMNDDLRLDDEEVKSESPVNFNPRENARITCLVGGNELPEFVRQNELLEGWKPSGAKVRTISDQGKNHFSVIEPLADPQSLLTMSLLN